METAAKADASMDGLRAGPEPLAALPSVAFRSGEVPVR